MSGGEQEYRALNSNTKSHFTIKAGLLKSISVSSISTLVHCFLGFTETIMIFVVKLFRMRAITISEAPKDHLMYMIIV